MSLGYKVFGDRYDAFGEPKDRPRYRGDPAYLHPGTPQGVLDWEAGAGARQLLVEERMAQITADNAAARARWAVKDAAAAMALAPVVELHPSVGNPGAGLAEVA